MTKHPLTDEICRDLTAHMDFYNPTVQRNDMRTAADWRLDRVIEWLKENLNRSYYLRPVGLHSYEIDTLDVIEDLKEAMPAQEDK